jgi:hypothetical protein
MKKNVILICGGIILIIAAGLLVFAKYQSHLTVQKAEKKSESSQASTSTSESTTASSTISQHPTLAEIDAVKIDESNWQTYTNKQYGFKISTPKNWTTTLTSSDKSLTNNGSLQISPTTNSQSDIPVDLFIADSDGNLSIRDFVAKKYMGADSLTKINIPTSDEAEAYFFSEGGSQALYSYFIKKGKLIYEFDPMEWGSDILYGNAQMRAIVETFRFTK